jgi:4-amino-4-deoxy-L-arabinose transferase-like glycosyltransferase
MNAPARRAFLLVALWAAVVAGGLASRPAWPIDETRYLSVAWEMWEGGDFLVPHLNGLPYSDKPPLLFWLIQAGWRLFGVNEWWPRIVPSLFALASLFLTARLARKLWPDRPAIAKTAPFLMLATLLWSFFSTVLLFDMLLVFFVLVGVEGLVRASRGERRGWLLVFAAVGLGILAKGPAILIWILPAALAAPWWAGGAVRPLRWYPLVLTAAAAGIALALAWAVPAALSGSSAYADAILWNQTAGRVTRAFAHRQPFWWYAPFVPLLVFPWILWTGTWRRTPRKSPLMRDPGVRLCATWSVGGFFVFSLVSGKQIQYLLPLLPSVALLAARASSNTDAPASRRGLMPIAGAFVLLGALLAGARALAEPLGLPVWISALSPAYGIAVAAIGVALLIPGAASRGASFERIAVCSVAAIVVMQLAIGRAASPNYDVKGIARYLNRLESEGHALAHVGKYRGEYHFAGRLRKPLEVIRPNDVATWFSRHPNGYVVIYSDRSLVPEPEDELFHVFRGGVITVRHRIGRSPNRRRTSG